jgi:hypothetical protein
MENSFKGVDISQNSDSQGKLSELVVIEDAKPFIELKNDNKVISALDYSRMYHDIINHEFNKDDIGQKGQQVLIGYKLKYQVGDIVYQTNKEVQNSGGYAKKLTMRDFIESAIINYLDKYNS